jgi:hypothetical protein
MTTELEERMMEAPLVLILRIDNLPWAGESFWGRAQA